MVNSTPWPFYSRERYPVLTVQEAAWSPGPVIMKGGTKVIPPPETIVRLILKFTYIVSMPFTNLKLVFYKVFIINILFPPLHETLYAIHIKFFAAALELITQAVFQHYP